MDNDFDNDTDLKLKLIYDKIKEINQRNAGIRLTYIEEELDRQELLEYIKNLNLTEKQQKEIGYKEIAAIKNLSKQRSSIARLFGTLEFMMLAIVFVAFILAGFGFITTMVTPAAQPTMMNNSTAQTANGSDNVYTAPTPSPVTTPAPAVTASPIPDHGVKQTEYGYYITYQTLSSETWSNYPPIRH